MEDEFWTSSRGKTHSNPLADSLRGQRAEPKQGLKALGSSQKAFEIGRRGEAASLKLLLSGEPLRAKYVSYLQQITIDLDEATGQLCLLCHASKEIVFIEGENLEPLADAIADKRVKVIRISREMRDKNDSVVTKITVEEKI